MLFSWYLKTLFLLKLQIIGPHKGIRTSIFLKIIGTNYGLAKSKQRSLIAVVRNSWIDECLKFYVLLFFGFFLSLRASRQDWLECRAGVWTYESINWSMKNLGFIGRSESFSAYPMGGNNLGRKTLLRLKQAKDVDFLNATDGSSVAKTHDLTSVQKWRWLWTKAISNTSARLNSVFLFLGKQTFRSWVIQHPLRVHWNSGETCLHQFSTTESFKNVSIHLFRFLHLSLGSGENP